LILIAPRFLVLWAVVLDSISWDELLRKISSVLLDGTLVRVRKFLPSYWDCDIIPI
jgi:hypothetical protein